MAKKTDAVIAQVVKLLFDEQANEWSIQDKGALLGAIKLQLMEKTNAKAKATTD